MAQKRIETPPSDVRGIGVLQIVKATCMAGDCAFNLLVFQGVDLGMQVNDLQDAVRIHVRLSGHRVYIDDRRGTIVGPAE